MRDSPRIFYTGHIVTISSTELYSLMKIFLMEFKIEGNSESVKAKVVGHEQVSLKSMHKV